MMGPGVKGGEGVSDAPQEPGLDPSLCRNLDPKAGNQTVGKHNKVWYEPDHINSQACRESWLSVLSCLIGGLQRSRYPDTPCSACSCVASLACLASGFNSCSHFAHLNKRISLSSQPSYFARLFSRVINGRKETLVSQLCKL